MTVDNQLLSWAHLDRAIDTEEKFLEAVRISIKEGNRQSTEALIQCLESSNKDMRRHFDYLFKGGNGRNSM